MIEQCLVSSTGCLPDGECVRHVLKHLNGTRSQWGRSCWIFFIAPSLSKASTSVSYLSGVCPPLNVSDQTCLSLLPLVTLSFTRTHTHKHKHRMHRFLSQPLQPRSGPSGAQDLMYSSGAGTLSEGREKINPLQYIMIRTAVFLLRDNLKTPFVWMHSFYFYFFFFFFNRRPGLKHGKGGKINGLLLWA